MITIATFGEQTEANFLVSRLEADNIPCYLQDEYLVQQDWLLAPLLGGIKVQVPEEHFARARQIATDVPEVDAEGNPLVNADDETDLEELAMASQPYACPKCASERVRPMTLRQIMGYLVREGRAEEPISPVDLEVWECLECGTAWEPGQTSIEEADSSH